VKRNVTELKSVNPAKAFAILKRLGGAQETVETKEISLTLNSQGYSQIQVVIIPS